jgi:hypothetical protein
MGPTLAIDHPPEVPSVNEVLDASGNGAVDVGNFCPVFMLFFVSRDDLSL